MTGRVASNRVQVYHDHRELRADMTALRSEYTTEGEGLTDKEFVIDAWENGVREPYIEDVSYA